MIKISENALVCAFSIDANGRGKTLSSDEIQAPSKTKQWKWIHLDRTAEETALWLCDSANVPTIATTALLAEETRPGLKEFSDGHVINLRGINLNADASQEDMVAIRLWVTPEQVISLRRFKLMAIQDLRDKYENGLGPKTIGSFISELCHGLTQRISNKLSDLEESLDLLEEAAIEKPSAKQRNEVMDIRRKAIPLKRFLFPQRDALEELSRLNVKWLSTTDKEHIREAYHQLSRIIEALDAFKERATLLQEELTNLSAEIANNNTYVLTIVAAIFLPLGFLTGLLGINVGGVPGMENPWAFTIICLLMIIIGVIEIIILKWLKWI